MKVIQNSHAGLKGAKVVNLRPKHQIRQLGIGQEHDEEHDGEAHEVLNAA